jgi:hypothetical protein
MKTFFHVVKITLIHVLLTVTIQFDWETHQLDVKIPFLNGYFDEKIFMVTSQGLEKTSNIQIVCKLLKSIYGLWQSFQT